MQTLTLSNKYKHAHAHMYCFYQYVPHKAVAEVSKIANYRRLVAVKHGSHSKSTAGSKSGWRQRSVVIVVVASVVGVEVLAQWRVV